METKERMQKKCLKTKPAKPNVPQAKLGLPNSEVQSLLLDHRMIQFLKVISMQTILYNSNLATEILYTAQIFGK